MGCSAAPEGELNGGLYGLRSARLVLVVDLIRIGYWRSDLDRSLPDPADFVDDEWDDDERWAVAAYLRSGTIAAAYMGYSACRLCGAHNGSLEFTDGRFRWPEGLTHYVEDHNVRLPAEVVEHAATRLAELESASVADEWWKTEMANPVGPAKREA